MLLGPDVAQDKINQQFDEFLPKIMQAKSADEKEQLQLELLVEIYKIINASDADILSKITLEKTTIEKLKDNRCDIVLSQLIDRGFHLPVAANEIISLHSLSANFNRYSNKSQRQQLKQLAELSDIELISDKRSSLCTFVAKYAMSMAGGYCSSLANRNLKLLNTRIENIIYNVTVLAGHEAGFKLADLISGMIADTSVDLVTKYGTSFIIDYITGASMGYLVQSALSSNGNMAVQVAKILSEFITKGASDVFASGFAQTFTPGICEILTKTLIAKPAIIVSKKVSSKVNNNFAVMEAPYNFYNQTKNTIHDYITRPIAQTVYRGPLRDFVTGYYAGLGGEFSRMKAKEVADNHIKGKIKPFLDSYIDHLFPGQPLSHEQYCKLEDLTDNYSEHEANFMLGKEELESKTYQAAKSYIKNTYPELTQTIANMGSQMSAFLENTLNIPQHVVEKMLNGEELSNDDFSAINEHKYGYLKNYFIQSTVGAYERLSFTLKYLGITWDHEGVAAECAELLRDSITMPEISNFYLNRLNEKLDSLEGYPDDRAKVVTLLNAIVDKEHLFTEAIRIIARKLQNIQTKPTPEQKNNIENMLAVIQWFVDNNYGPSQLDERGVSPLHLVIAKIENEAICIKMLEVMLASNADLSVTTLMGNENPLHLAAFHGKDEVLAFLISKLSKDNKDEILNGETRRLQTPLHCAIPKGHKKIAIQLINNGASLTSKDEDDNYAFALTNQNTRYRSNKPEFIDIEVMEALDKRLELNLHDEIENDLISDHERERRILLTLGASSKKFVEVENARFDKGYKPYLLTLLEEGQIDWAHYLVFGNKNLMALPCILPGKKSPINYCLAILKLVSRRDGEKAADILEYLLQQIKSYYPGHFLQIINNHTLDEPSLLFDVVTSGNVKAFNTLVGKGADIDVVNYYGDSLLLRALKDKQYSVAKWLLENGANPLVTNKFGENAVTYWQSMYHNVPTLDKEYKALYKVMQSKLDINFMTKHYLHDDTNALMTYCKLLLETKNIELIKEKLAHLLKKYPDFINQKDFAGNTLLNYTYTLDMPDLSLWLLKEHHANPRIENNAKQSFCTLWNSKSNISVNPWKKADRNNVTSYLATLNTHNQPQEAVKADDTNEKAIERKTQTPPK